MTAAAAPVGEAGQMEIKSSDPALLRTALETAEDLAQRFAGQGVAGVVFLGAVVRGYFDHASDIDIAVFTRRDSPITPVPQYQRVNGIEIHSHVADIEDEARAVWDMPKRWAFSASRIRHDPDGAVSRLLEEKVPLRPAERRWLLISGITLSEWYTNRLTELWVERGSVASAHTMFGQGLNHFYDALFSLNNELVADHKWRYYCAERLAVLPPGFRRSMEEAMMLRAVTEDELKRRRSAFMGMWKETLPLVEAEVGATFDEFKDTV